MDNRSAWFAKEQKLLSLQDIPPVSSTLMLPRSIPADPVEDSAPSDLADKVEFVPFVSGGHGEFSRQERQNMALLTLAEMKVHNAKALVLCLHLQVSANRKGKWC